MSIVGTTMHRTLVLTVLVALFDTCALAQTADDVVQRCHSYTAPESSGPDRAISACTTVIESTRSTRSQQLDALAERGGLFRKTGRFDLAIVDLTEVLRNRASADDVYVERGMALAANRQPDLALADFDEAIGLNPNNRIALSQRATLYRARGRFDEAIRDLDRAVVLNRDDPWAVSERGLD